MKTKRRSTFWMGFCFLALVLCFSGLGETSRVQAASAGTITSTRETLCRGKKKKLSVRGVKKKVFWKSSNPKIVSVTSKGYVTAKKSGTAVITAKTGKETFRCKVTVRNHKYGKASCRKAAACLRCGKIKGKALGHDYKPATCTKAAVCRRCGKTKGKALGHSYRISGEKQICRRCGKKTARDYQKVTEEQAYDAMIALKKKYPQGMPWTNEDFYHWKGGIYDLGFGCAAFAFRLSDAAFGNLKARTHTDFSRVKVGDILRINGDSHSVIVLEVDRLGVTVAEGNYNSSINWGRFISFETLRRTGDYVMTRYPRI